MEDDTQKLHKKRKAGAKFNKKKKQKFDIDETDDPKKRNPKAFSFQVNTQYGF